MGTTIMKLMTTLACLVLISVGSPIWAAEISAEIKAKTQLSMAEFMKSRSDADGRFHFVDDKTNKAAFGFSANVHPMVVPYGQHIFVCSEVVLENGERITADFLTVKIDGAYKVVEVIMNNRDRVKGMMKDK